CAKVALGQSATPAIIEDTVKHLDRLDAELVALRRESVAGARHDERLEALTADRTQASRVLEESRKRLKVESELAQRIQALRNGLEAGSHSVDSHAAESTGANDAAAPQPEEDGGDTVVAARPKTTRTAKAGKAALKKA